MSSLAALDERINGGGSSSDRSDRWDRGGGGSWSRGKGGGNSESGKGGGTGGGGKGGGSKGGGGKGGGGKGGGDKCGGRFGGGRFGGGRFGGGRFSGGRFGGCACTLDALPPGVTLLGDACSFCDAFFHVRDTREAGLPLCCLRHPGECEGRNTVIVARLCDGSGRELFVGRFMNRDKQTHAERVMIQDGQLRSCLETSSGGTLAAFISLQPCHHSSGNEKISCTTDLLRFHEQVLQPLGVAFELAIAYPCEAPPEMQRARPSDGSEQSCPPSQRDYRVQRASALSE